MHLAFGCCFLVARYFLFCTSSPLGVCFLINFFRASCFIISWMERHERKDTWKPIEKNLSMEGAISLQNRKVIGKLVFYTHKGNCDHVVIQDILHISWMIVLTVVKPFVLWQLFITRGKIGGIFFSLQEMCFFQKKMSLLKILKSLKSKPWDSRYKEFKIELPNNHAIGHCVLLPNY
jgi:hypothetical protein